MMKRYLFVIALLLGTLAVAQEPLWLRHCAISPDGTTIVFGYKGDLYTVPVKGGRAFQLTSNAAYDTNPVWSPDSRWLLFSSDRMGSQDLYIVSREGGEPRRLTTHSRTETPLAFVDATHVLFTMDEMPSAESVNFPSGQFQQVYQLNLEGGRPQLYLSMPMEHLSIASDGRMLYQDKKGYEDPWRKHHVSPIARDVWMYTPQGEGAFTRLTAFEGEDREPVWAPDGKSFYYLSEEKGSFNVFQRKLGETVSTQLTRHTIHPVRYLSAAEDGTMCYSYNGELYTLKEGEQPQKVQIQVVADKSECDVVRQLKNGGATEMAVSPDGKEVAFVLRGDVYVTSVEYNTTRQVTNTPCQERDVQFSPDGRSLVYASERNGLWQLYITSLVRKEEKLFAYATELKEEQLTHSSVTSFQPQFSPDGKEVAFLEDRTAIRVINLKSKAVRTVMDGKWQYSYSDGDQWFQWSPDSRWLLADFIAVGGWNNKDVALVKADGSGEIINLTQSGYNDGNAKWVLDGKAMIWTSDRAGFRSHGSWGAENDVYIMFFDADAYDRFLMNKEEAALFEEAEKEAEKEKEKEKDEKKEHGKKDKKTEEKKEKPVEPLQFDLDNRFDRIVRLTVHSSHLGDALLTKKGDALYYIASFEGGADLWEHNLRENRTQLLIKKVGRGALATDKEQKQIFLCGWEGMKKIEVKEKKITPITFEALFDYRPYAEREYIFDHAWQQVKDKFYKTDLHGADWQGFREAYRRFLPHINNNYDFAEMLSEMLGELNGSHTGCRYYAPGATLSTAALGVFYDPAYTGLGLKIKEIIAQSPLTKKKTEVAPGCVIEKIDGQPIGEMADYFPLLEGKAGKRVVLTVYNPATGKRFEERLKPITYGEQTELLYKRWVEHCRKTVDSLSGGRIGYVHIQSMNSASFRRMYSELLGREREKEAVVVDVRHNGGGWLHDDVVTLLGGKEYQRFVPRGQYIGSDPFNKWNKPSCMLICEDNYSNAHGTPFVYKTLGIGPLVGAPIAGTMTAVWWETQIDRSLVFGIPQVGCVDMDGNYLENMTLRPDIEVYNRPEDVLRGYDAQLKAAVDCLLQQLDGAK